MKFIFWKYRFIFPLFVIPLLLVILWFHNGLIHGGGDEELLFANDKNVFQISSTTWLREATGFAVLYWLSRLSFVLIVVIFHSVFFIPNIILQAATFFILLTTGALSVYFLTKILIGTNKYKEYIGFVAAIFYILNPFSMSQVWGRGQFAQFFSFALLPLSLLLFIYGIRKRNYSYAILFALVSLIFSTSYGFITFIAVQWFVVFIYAILEGFSSKKLSIVLFIIKFYLLSLLLWSIVNFWWLLPLALKGGSILGNDLSNSNENIGTLLGVSAYYPLPIIIRLLQSFYFFSTNAYSPVYAILRYQLMSIIPVIFLIVGTIMSFWKKRNFGYIFFLLTFFIGLVISLGANPPFGTLFVWVFQHVTVLQAFRNPYEKFGLVYMLGYSQLVGLGVVFLYKFLANNTKKIILFTPLLFCGIFIIWNIFLWPMWNGQIFANANGKIGLSVPEYYTEFQEWLDVHNDGYRVMLTPLWSGDSGSYEWNSTLYQGVDPMDILLNTDVISSTGNVPYYFSFAQNIRKYMQQINIHPALELLRVKYLVNRNDAVQISESEKNQFRTISQTIYPLAPLDIDSVCEKQHVSVSQNTQAVIVCEVPLEKSDWGNIQYFKLTLTTDVPSYVEVVVRDAKETKINWDGRGDSDYLVGNHAKTIIFPLRMPNNPNSAMDFSHIHYIEIYAHPVKNPGGSVSTISLDKIGLNTGIKTDINEFKLLQKVGKLDIYAPNSLIVPPEFGLLSSIKSVADYKGLFQEAEKNRNNLDTTGFVIRSQNKGSVSLLSKTVYTKALATSRISDTKYWIKIPPEKTSYIILSKTYYSEWKLLKGIDKKMLDGSFIHDIQLLTSPAVSEQKHFVVNGYANLWVVNGKDTEYAAVFIPQVIMEIGLQVSVTTVIILLIVLVLIYNKFFVIRYKRIFRK